MKKLNRKGFTLVELLAVIIILAIVVGITIPAITNIINNSKNSALGVVVDAAEDYLADQYAYYNVDANTASTAFKNVVTGPVTSQDLTYGTAAHTALLDAMGFSDANIETVTIKIDDTGVACVIVGEVDTDGEYYSTTYFNTDGTPKTGAKNNSKSCGNSVFGGAADEETTTE